MWLRQLSRRFLAFAAAAAAAAAAGLAPSEAAAARALVVAIDISDAKSLDPARFYETDAMPVLHAAYETLVTNEGGDVATIVPRLAEKLPVISDDLRTFTFTLRRGVTFASGNPLTSRDVKWSFERLKNLKGNPAWLADPIDRIETPDDRTVRIVLKSPDASFLTVLTSYSFSVLDSELVRKHGGSAEPGADKADTAQAFLDQTSAGTGPYVLKGWTRQSEIVIERNPKYWRGPAPVERIVFKHVKELATQKLLLERGDADIAINLGPDQAESFRGKPGFRVVVGDTLNLDPYLALTTSPERSAPLSRQEVRQAIRHAIDYEGLTKGVFRGLALQVATAIPVGLLGNDRATNARYLVKQDLARARDLLARAGYPDGFEFTLTYPTKGAMETVAQKLQADLARVGIRARLEPMETSLHRTAYREKKLMATLSDWTPDFPDPHGWAEPFGIGGAARRMFYDQHQSPKVGELVRQANGSADPARRGALYRELIGLMAADAVWAVVLQPQVQHVMSDRVGGYVFHPGWTFDAYTLTLE